MAVSTPERSPATHGTLAEPAAPARARARRPTEKGRQLQISVEEDEEGPEAQREEIEVDQHVNNFTNILTRKSTTNKEILLALATIIQQQGDIIKEAKDELRNLRAEQQELKRQNTELIGQITDLKTSFESIISTDQTTRSWTSVVMGNGSTNSNATSRTTASHSYRNGTSPSPIDIPYVTVDISRVESEDGRMSASTVRTAIERELRAREKQENWRCRAVTVDQRNQNRIRIACRSEDEHLLIKSAAEKIGAGSRVLRDELHPIKIDNVKRTAVLDEFDNVRTGAAEAFGGENGTTVAKIAWLSKKDVPKAYGSMVVYLTKGSDARRLITEGFFHAGGESGTTSAFEHRPRPEQCYNCQEIGHKAYQCKRTQKCARCAKDGHDHRNCSEAVPKCIPCGGPHESFSRNCRKLYPSHHE
jgi:hypothetical protein